MQGLYSNQRTCALARGILHLLAGHASVQRDQIYLVDSSPVLAALLREAEEAEIDDAPIFDEAAYQYGTECLVSTLNAAQLTEAFAATASALGNMRGPVLTAAVRCGAAESLTLGLAAHLASEPAQAAGIAAAAALAAAPGGLEALWAAGISESLAAALKWHSDSDRVLALVGGLLDALEESMG